ncbi:unnamed protein product, partial [Arabidopsis halleri]
ARETKRKRSIEQLTINHVEQHWYIEFLKSTSFFSFSYKYETPSSYINQ